MHQFVKAFIITASILICDALYSSKSPVIALTEQNFKEQVLESDGIWIVEFYAPWCGHCKNLKPDYEKAASHLKGIVNVGAVDATVSESLARKYDIKGFPTIKIFSSNKKQPTNYEGQRTADAIVTEAMSSARRLIKDRQSGKDSGSSGPKKEKNEKKEKRKQNLDVVVELTSENFDELVLGSDEEWVIKFIAPWCGHCKNLAPEFQSAAEEMSTEVKSGTVDCTVETALAQKYGVKGYPTIYIFPPGKKSKKYPIQYNGPRESSAIVSEAMSILRSSDVSPTIHQITGPSKFNGICEGTKKICVVSTMPHIIEGGKEVREGYLGTVAAAAKEMKNAVFSFLWTEVSAQPAFEEKFGLAYGAPALIAVSMEKGVYAAHVGAFDATNIATFLRGILSGAVKTAAFENFPPLIDVVEWDGEDAPPVEEEFSLEDLFEDDEMFAKEL